MEDWLADLAKEHREREKARLRQQIWALSGQEKAAIARQDHRTVRRLRRSLDSAKERYRELGP